MKQDINALKNKFDVERIISDVGQEAAKQSLNIADEEKALLLNMPEVSIPSTKETIDTVNRELKILQRDAQAIEQITTVEEAIRLYQSHDLDQLAFNYVAGLIKEQLNDRLNIANSRLKLLRIYINASTQNRTISFVIADPYRYLRPYSNIPQFQEPLKKMQDSQLKEIDMVITDINLGLTQKFEKKARNTLIKQVKSLQEQAEHQKVKYNEHKDQVLNSPTTFMRRHFFSKKFEKQLSDLDKEKQAFMDTMLKGTIMANRADQMQKNVDQFNASRQQLMQDAQLIGSVLKILQNKNDTQK